MKMTCYNSQQLDTVIEDMRREFDKHKRLNIVYEKSSKEKTKAQIGFTFAALINQITAYFQDCGFNVNEEDVRYKLYDDVSQIVPEMVIDKQLFGGRPRIIHIPEMDRELLSKFINGVFEVLDTFPVYAGAVLSPDTYMNFLFHIDIEELKIILAYEKPERDEKYLEYIRSRPCICCGIQHRSHAHHAKIPKYVMVGKKTPDWTAIPLCPHCHLEGAHQQGHDWLLRQLKWLPYDLESVCSILYFRYKHKIGI